MMASDLSKYIGLEYEKYNCLDLVRDFYKDILNVEVTQYLPGDEIPDRREVQTLIASNRGDFIRIEEGKQKFGDLVVINLYGVECHLAVYVTSRWILHSVKGTGSCLDQISKYKPWIGGYYRHRELAQ